MRFEGRGKIMKEGKIIRIQERKKSEEKKEEEQQEASTEA